MKRLIVTPNFKKDLVLMNKRGLKIQKLEEIITLPLKGEKLPAYARPHKLKGNYAHLWECHIAPDWLLIYVFDENSVTLMNTGTHSDLF